MAEESTSQFHTLACDLHGLMSVGSRRDWRNSTAWLRTVLVVGLTALPAIAIGATGTTRTSLIKVSDLDLDQYRGRVVYLDFWASWCGPCRKSFPWLDALQHEHAGHGLIVIGVNLDRETESAEKFLSDVPVGFQIVLDPEATLALRYGVTGMPESVILDREGDVAFRHVGFFNRETGEYESKVEELLAR